ncbi:bactofilin family protein [Odoribacter lunatus]|uniref:bactofilin family protein n=1 Tax=Odoribacter lunatus TaxID=2941335 RepID=UPI00203D97C8|nr:polymer-forming cytoskeletal protein [Odoribacter lunatus]
MDNLEKNTTNSFLLEEERIEGNVRIDNNLLLEGTIKGDVVCKGRLTVEQHGVIEGNVVCGSLVMEGLIVGDVEVEGRAHLAEQAEIKGTLTASCLLVHPEAEIENGLRLKNK